MLRLEKTLSLEEYIQRCESIPPHELEKPESNLYYSIESGFYVKHLSAWIDVFGLEDLKITFFEHLQQDSKAFLIDLCQWLALEYEEFITSLNLSVENKTVGYRNKALLKLALAINWRGEKFWRTHPNLKRNLRSIYYKFNGASGNESMSSDTRQYLNSIFAPYNQQFALQLRDYGYTNLPAWLSQDVDSLSISPQMQRS